MVDAMVEAMIDTMVDTMVDITLVLIQRLMRWLKVRLM